MSSNRYPRTTVCLSLALCVALITQFTLVSSCAAQSVLPSRQWADAISESRLAAKEMLDSSGAPGCQVAVSINGKLVFSEAFGLSNVESNARVTTETKYGIGSISKSLTCALLLKLCDEEKCELDDPIKNYLSEFPHDDAGITLRSIAGHLSGLDDHFAASNRYNSRHFETTDDALVEIYQDQLRYPPGTRSFYGTGTYTLLAGSIERITDTPFLEAMNAKLIEPLKLTSIVSNLRTPIISSRASFYETDDDGQLINAPYFDPSHKWAGAGFLATAADLTKFADAIFWSEFLSKGSKAAMLEDQKTAAGARTGFGLGWRIDEDDQGQVVYYQPGGGPGISSQVLVLPDNRITVAVLTNLTGAPVGNVARTVANSFLRELNTKEIRD